MSAAGAVVALLDGKMAGGEWGTGWQAALRTRGGLNLDLCGGADGRGTWVTPSTRFCVYCAGKPITAVCVGSLVDQGEVSFDDSLGDLVTGIRHPALAGVTINELLRHTAGLGRFPAALFLSQPASSRDRMLLDVEPEFARTYVTTYSEFVAWELLRLAIEAVVGCPFEDAVTATVLAPLGLTNRLCFTLAEEEASDLGLNVAVRSTGIEPLLWELSQTNLSEAKASTGLIASASSLADFYLALCAAFDGGGVPVSAETLVAMVAAPAIAAFDPVLDRSCKLGAGFMVDLDAHHFGRFGTSSFGHSGLSGMTFAGCDPARGIAFAVHINGFLERDREAEDRRAEERREAVMAAVIQEFDASRDPATGLLGPSEARGVESGDRGLVEQRLNRWPSPRLSGLPSGHDQPTRSP